MTDVCFSPPFVTDSGCGWIYRPDKGQNLRHTGAFWEERTQRCCHSGSHGCNKGTADSGHFLVWVALGLTGRAHCHRSYSPPLQTSVSSRWNVITHPVCRVLGSRRPVRQAEELQHAGSVHVPVRARWHPSWHRSTRTAAHKNHDAQQIGELQQRWDDEQRLTGVCVCVCVNGFLFRSVALTEGLIINH